MSVRVMNEVWEQAMDLSGSRLLVMLALADWANDEGVCWPSVRTLAHKARIDRATAYRVLADLEAEGYIERSSRPGHSSLFRVHPVLEQGSHPATGASDLGGSHPATGGSQDATGGVASGHTGGRTGATQNHQEPPAEPPGNRAPSDDGAAQLSLVPLPQPEVSAQRRKPDHVWEAVLFVSGVDGSAIPKSARGAYNRAVADLKAVGATPEEVVRRAAIYRAKWPEVSLTPTALARRWAECEQYVPSSPAHALRQQAEADAVAERLRAMDAADAARGVTYR